MQSLTSAPVQGSNGRATRILLVADAGTATAAAEAAMIARGYGVTRVSAESAELFTSALGHQALMYLPESHLLAPRGAATADERVREVLRACRAPGVRVLVVGLPAASAFDATLDAVRRDGKPFIVVRAPGLLEEVAEALPTAHDTLWLPRGGAIHVARASAWSEALVDALESDEQGRVRELPAESFDVAGLFAAATELARRDVRVRAVPPLVYRVARPVARWIRGGEPELLAMADRWLTHEPALAAPSGESARGVWSRLALR